MVNKMDEVQKALLLMNFIRESSTQADGTLNMASNDTLSCMVDMFMESKDAEAATAEYTKFDEQISNHELSCSDFEAFLNTFITNERARAFKAGAQFALKALSVKATV